MTHIDLFSGIGGFALAAHWAGFTTEVFCERDPFCQQVLAKHWPTVPVVSDIHEFDGSQYAGADLLTGGFPCQPFSIAGKQQGTADDRYLWPEMLRVISEARPRWIVGENVPGIIGMALDNVLADLENEGYETGALVLPACAVNAPHRRDRVWIVAHANRHDQYGRAGDVQMGRISEPREAENDGVPERTKRQSQSRMGERHDGLPARLVGYWDDEWERGIPRICEKVPGRAAKLKALGNAIVPQVAYEILRHAFTI